MNLVLHSRENPFYCTRCYYRSNQKYKLDHMVYMTIYIEYILRKCSYCENERNSLHGNLHCENERNELNEVFHTGNKPFQCSKCDYRFYQLTESGHTVDIYFFYEKDYNSKYDAHCEFHMMLYTRENVFLWLKCEFFINERNIEHLHKAWSS